jgi:hypothetical protein
LLLLIHPARDGNQHQPKRVENAHCSTVSWALCIVFNAFDFLDNTRSMKSNTLISVLRSERLGQLNRHESCPKFVLRRCPSAISAGKVNASIRKSRFHNRRQRCCCSGLSAPHVLSRARDARGQAESRNRVSMAT